MTDLTHSHNTKTLEVMVELTNMDLDFGVIHGFRRKILRMAGDIDICCSDRECFVSTLKKTIQSQGGILISDSKNFGNGIVITGVFPKNNWKIK